MTFGRGACCCENIAGLTEANVAGLIEAMNAYKPCGCVGDGQILEPENTVEGDPPPSGFSEYDPSIVDRKCKLANMTHDDVLDVTKKLKVMGVENAPTLGVGTTAGIIDFAFSLLEAGPVRWGMTVLGSITGAVAFFLTQAIDLDALIAILENPSAHEGGVTALYNAPDNTQALADWKTVLTSYGATGAHLAYLDAIKLINGLTAMFFQPDGAEGVLISQRLGGFVSLIACTPAAAPTDWIYAPDGGWPFGSTTPSGIWGSGVIDQGGGTFTVTAVPRNEAPGQYMVALVVRHYWDNLTTPGSPSGGPATVIPGTGCSIVGHTGANPIQSSGGRMDNCGGFIDTTNPGFTFPTSLNRYVYWHYVATGPFTFDVQITSTPTICP